MAPREIKEFEFQITKDFIGDRDDAKTNLNRRINGTAAKAGASGYQFAGYTRLERFYRGDQFAADEPAGASQKVDNYCAVIVDNLASLIFDAPPELNCPTNDPSDDLLEIKAELKEQMIFRVWEENDFEVEFDEWSKVASLYGDGFMFGPYMDKDERGQWVIRFNHVENPGSITPVFADDNFKKISAFIYSQRVSQRVAEKLYGDMAKARGIKFQATIRGDIKNRSDQDTDTPMVLLDHYWDDETHAVFHQDKLIDYEMHNWGFVPLEFIKNIHSPNYPFGKSDIEDVLDPQLSHNRTNNDMANLLRWLSTVNLWGKNLEGMQALVAGLSRIYSLPEDGELHTFEKPGDPYITNTYVAQRKSAIIEISGVSESTLSSSQVSAASGRALALAFQGTIRKLNPRMKRFQSAIENLNRNILKLTEIYYPKTKLIINGDYRNKIFLQATILRNIVDTINKLQSGIISLDTAQKEAGVAQPKMEQRLMRKNLQDKFLGPQIARQPALLPRLAEGQNQPGESPLPAPGNRVSSAAGAPAANNQQASGAAATPQ